MEINFKFSIGQFVTTRESLAQHKAIAAERTEADRNLDSRLGKLTAPISLFIVERHYQEYAGGLQMNYLCRYFVTDGYKVSLFNESELIEHPIIKNE